MRYLKDVHRNLLSTKFFPTLPEGLERKKGFFWKTRKERISKQISIHVDIESLEKPMHM